MSFIAHAACPSCPSCSARADVLEDEDGYLIGSVFVCDHCGTAWVEMREAWVATRGSIETRESIEKGIHQ